MSNTSLLGSFGGQGDSSLMFRNRIINGAMEICQRYGTTARTPTASEYVLDRWQLQVTQASKLTVQQTFTGGSSSIGFPAYMGISGSTAYSPLNTDFFAMRQCIEGFNIADLGWGTAAAKPITISFLVNCTKTGTFSGSLTNGDSGARRSYAFTYTVNSVNTWEYKTITIPGDTSGNWYTDNREGINLYLDCGSGSNYRTTAGAWGAGTFVGATGSYSLVSNLPATLYITGVQLEAGPTATPFERRPIGVELGMCQRYCYQMNFSGATATNLICVGTSASGGRGNVRVLFPVTMRGNPVYTSVPGASGFLPANDTIFTAFTNTSSYSTTVNGASITMTGAGSGFLNGVAAVLETNTTNYMRFDAEL